MYATHSVSIGAQASSLEAICAEPSSCSTCLVPSILLAEPSSKHQVLLGSLSAFRSSTKVRLYCLLNSLILGAITVLPYRRAPIQTNRCTETGSVVQVRSARLEKEHTMLRAAQIGKKSIALRTQLRKVT